MGVAPDSEQVDQEFLVAQRVRLQEEREETERVLERLDEEIDGLTRRREAAGAEEGFGHVNTVSIDLDRARSQHVNAVARLEEIEAAIMRIDAGTYGQCEDCGGPIGRARLEAVPETTRCVTCQARAGGSGPR